MKPDYEVARTLMRMGNSDMMKRIMPEAVEILDENETLKVHLLEEQAHTDHLEQQLEDSE